MLKQVQHDELWGLIAPVHPRSAAPSQIARTRSRPNVDADQPVAALTGAGLMAATAAPAPVRHLVSGKAAIVKRNFYKTVAFIKNL